MFQSFGFTYRRLALQGLVLAACVAMVSSPGSALQGKGQWDPAVVQMYFRHNYGVVGNGGLDLDIGPGPGSYPGRQMLTGLTQTCHYDDGTKYTLTSQVNAEFAKRVDVLMAVYRAAGGKDVGIVPCSGALRSAEDQLRLFRQGRHDPAGPNGHTPVAQWVLDNPKVPCPKGRTVTCETVSWHNVGLAVDFGQFKASKYDNGSAFLYSPAFQSVYTAMDDLGMLTGQSFGDSAHVDWHPYLTTPASAGSSGTVANVNAGYAWSFPNTVYFSNFNADGSAGALTVYDFGSDGNWITVKDWRYIQINGKDEWEGEWVTYSPAVKAFPAYIPTISLENYDKLYKAVSSVEIKSYSIHAGKEFWRDSKGSLAYYPAFTLNDLQKEANVQIGKARSLRANSCGETIERFWPGCGPAEYRKTIKPYALLNVASYYNVHCGTAGMTPVAPVTVRAHDDWHENGSGPADWERQDAPRNLEGISLDIGWNRDKGLVGQTVIHRGQPENGDQYYELKPKSLGLQIISSQLPAGATDKSEPPSWPW